MYSNVSSPPTEPRISQRQFIRVTPQVHHVEEAPILRRLESVKGFGGSVCYICVNIYIYYKYIYILYGWNMYTHTYIIISNIHIQYNYIHIT